VVGPADVFFCENGAYPVGGRVIHDTHKYGYLSLGEIIKLSSNIGAAKVGRKLGRAKLHSYLKKFGFGGKTGVDLPGEVPGYLPAPQNWSEIGLANISFGQGVSLTALQLTSALGAVANDGLLMKPYVVKTVLKQGQIFKENQPKAQRQVISAETAKTVAAMLKTVLEDGGTGKAASLTGYEGAGKTGTAQKAASNGRGYSDKRVASFVGFVPADHPRIVISVFIDEPRGASYGGVVAAPVFKAIGEQVLPLLQVYPKGVTIMARAEPVWPPEEKGKTVSAAQTRREDETAAEEIGVMPDFSGKSIRQVVQVAKRLDLDLQFVGSGRAVAQNPAAGQVLQGHTKGVVKFQPTI
jgi:cell division protein FtsI (penicillin-binding protein 3)